MGEHKKKEGRITGVCRRDGERRREGGCGSCGNQRAVVGGQGVRRREPTAVVRAP